MPLSGVGIDLYTPSLPAVTTYFATEASLVKLTLNVYLLGSGLGQLFFGIMSDHWGRRKLLLSGLLIYIAVTVGIVFSPNIHALLGWRFVQGIAAGAPAALWRSVLADCFGGVALRREVSRMTMMWSIALIIAPALGGYLQHYFDWQANFWFLAGYGFLVFLLVYYFIPETIQQRSPFHFPTHIKHFMEILSHPVFLTATIMIALGYAISLLFSLVAPYLIQDVLRYNAVVYGHMALLVGFSYFIGNLLNTYLVKHVTLSKISLVGLIIISATTVTAVSLGLFYPMSLSTFIGPITVIFCALGLVQPNLLTRCIELFTHIAGMASSLLGSLLIMIAAIFSSSAVFLKANTQLPFALAIMVLAFANLILFLWVLRPRFSKD